jgi:hypothetical protein
MDCKTGFKSLDEKDIEKALIRAGQRAREDAKRWGTAVIVVRDGKLVKEYPQQSERVTDTDEEKR